MEGKIFTVLSILSLSTIINGQSTHLLATATNQINFLYADGVQITPLENAGEWSEIDVAWIDDYARVIAIRSNNVLGGCSGMMLAVDESPFGYTLRSNRFWKCHSSAPQGWQYPGFDDSDWPNATQVARNGQIVTGCSWIPLPEMPTLSYWIWSENWLDGDMVVSCRGYTSICDYSPCLNGGTCQMNEVDMCKCPVRYGGRFCELDINECDSNPCQNAGVCMLTPEGYECQCGIGYTGTHCETDLTDCASQPCQNGGTCNFIVEGGYECSCPPGFSGLDCETDIDECSSMPCQNNGTCTDVVNDVNCECDAGYTGQFCQTDIDECASNPCLHLGTCTDLVDGYTCDCYSGYTGAFCETAIGDCTTNPCLNGGTCTLEGTDGAVECVCPPGFSGTLCDQNDNECFSNPCLHGGTCTDGEGMFTCNCTAMYTGDRCELIVPNCGSVLSMSSYPPARNFWTLCEINILDHPNDIDTPCRDLITGITYYNDSATIIAMGGTFGCYPTKFPDEMPDGACVANYNQDAMLSSCLSCTHMGVCIDVPPPPAV